MMVVIIAYSYYNGSDLIYIIPEIFEVQPENSTVYIISPWINLNIDLIKPWDLTTIKLIDLIKLKSNNGIETEVYTSSKSIGEYNTHESIGLMKQNNIKHTVIKQLHSKAIIGKYIVYKGSANITYSALHTNKESVELYKTDDQKLELRTIIGVVNGA